MHPKLLVVLKNGRGAMAAAFPPCEASAPAEDARAARAADLQEGLCEARPRTLSWAGAPHALRGCPVQRIRSPAPPLQARQAGASEPAPRRPPARRAGKAGIAKKQHLAFRGGSALARFADASQNTVSVEKNSRDPRVQPAQSAGTIGVPCAHTV